MNTTLVLLFLQPTQAHRWSPCNNYNLFIYYQRLVLIGDFRVAFHLCFKASPSVKPFIWKLVLFTCKFRSFTVHVNKLISIWKALHLRTHFETETKGNSEIAYWEVTMHLKQLPFCYCTSNTLSKMQRNTNGLNYQLPFGPMYTKR